MNRRFDHLSNAVTLRFRSHFGTSPEPWNYLLKGMTLLPDSIMGNRDLMQALAEFSEPLVRITDKLVRRARFTFCGVFL